MGLRTAFQPNRSKTDTDLCGHRAVYFERPFPTQESQTLDLGHWYVCVSFFPSPGLPHRLCGASGGPRIAVPFSCRGCAIQGKAVSISATFQSSAALGHCIELGNFGLMSNAAAT